MFQGLPQKKYNTIVIDPPWPISLTGEWKSVDKRAKKLPYPTITIDQIKSFPLASLANVGAHVYLWATNKTLRPAFEVMESWQVRYHLTLVMAKTNGIAPCNGYVFATEFVLFGFFRKPMQRFKSMGKLNWFVKKNSRHSEKPSAFYDLVETMSPPAYLDSFARSARNGWDVWGDEVSIHYTY